MRLLGEKVGLRPERVRAVSVAAGWEPGYLSHILREEIALRASHLYTLLGVLRVEPERFFAELHPPERSESGLRRLLREAAARQQEVGLRTEGGGDVAGRPQGLDSPGAAVRRQVSRLGWLLRRALRARGVTSARASRFMGRPRPYLSQLLAGEPDLPLAEVYAVLAAIGVEPADFFGALHPAGDGGNGGDGGGGAPEGPRPLTRRELREEVRRVVRESLDDLHGPEDSSRGSDSADDGTRERKGLSHRERNDRHKAVAPVRDAPASVLAALGERMLLSSRPPEVLEDARAMLRLIGRAKERLPAGAGLPRGRKG